MRPVDSFYNEVNRTRTDLILRSQGFVRNAAPSIPVTDIAHVICGQFGFGVVFSARKPFGMGFGDMALGVDSHTMPIPARYPFWMRLGAVTHATGRSAFLNRITHIIGVGAKEEVIRIDARRVVALVADLHSFRDRAVRNLVGNAMRVMPHAIECQDAVADAVCRARPQPASGCLVYSSPKSALKWYVVASHGMFSLSENVYDEARAMPQTLHEPLAFYHDPLFRGSQI